MTATKTKRMRPCGAGRIGSDQRKSTLGLRGHGRIDLSIRTWIFCALVSKKPSMPTGERINFGQRFRVRFHRGPKKKTMAHQCFHFLPLLDVGGPGRFELPREPDAGTAALRAFQHRMGLAGAFEIFLHRKQP